MFTLFFLQNTLSLGNRVQQTQQQTTAQDVAAQIYNAQLQQQQQQIVRDNTSALSQVIPQARTTYGGVVNPFLMANTDPYAIDRAARLHRNAAGKASFLPMFSRFSLIICSTCKALFVLALCQ